MKHLHYAILILCSLPLTLWAQTNVSPNGGAVSNAIPGAIPVNQLTPTPGKLPDPVLLGPAPTNATTTATEHPLSGELESSIRPVTGGAVADFGLHKVQFPADISDPLQITTPGGQQLTCRPAFLALSDKTSGQSFMLGQVTNRIGSIVLPDRVIFTNALDTVLADIVYRYSGTANSLEQDVVLRQAIDLPSGWLPENVQVQVWTEWLNSDPQATETQTINLRPGAVASTSALAEDQVIKFDTMTIASGFAFGEQTPDQKIPVAKAWFPDEQQADVSWLVESIDYDALQSSLSLLPSVPVHFSQKGAKPNREGLLSMLSKRSPTHPNSQSMLVADNAEASGNGVVLDFVIISAVPAPSGIISWWPAGGNANDSIGSNNGTLVNGATFAAGKVGQTFSFNGTNQEVTVASASSLNPTTGVTLEGWIFATRYPTNDGVTIAGKDDPYSSRQYMLAYAKVSGQWILRPHVGLPGGLTYFNGTNVIPTNVWTHVAMTYDGSYLRLFVNGQEDSHAAATGAITTSSVPLLIGGSTLGSVNWNFPGFVDELSVYNRALSQSEIQSIYNAGGAGKINPQCVTPSGNTVGWWPGDASQYDFAGTNFAILQSGATYASGRVRQGFSFDGVSSYVELPDEPALNPTTALTLEAWIYETTNYSQNQPIFSKDNTSSQREYMLTVSSADKFRAHVNTSGGLYYFDGTTSVALNTWYHVAMTYDGSTLKLYVNGSLDNSASVTGNITTTTNTLRIGGSYSGSWGNYKFGGIIDEPTVYNAALSSTAISAIYSAGAAGKCLTDDTDGDGIPDWWERLYLGGLSQSASGDYDGDGLSNLAEYLLGTDPTKNDFGLKVLITKPKNNSVIP